MQAGNKAAVYPGDPFCEGQTEQFVLQMSFQPGGKDPPPKKKVLTFFFHKILHIFMLFDS